jgi:hypothetical protein
MQAICQGLTDPSTRVAAKACYALHNFAVASCSDEGDVPVGAQLLAKHYADVAKMLIVCAARADSDELDNEEKAVKVDLRAAGYEALCQLVEAMPTSHVIELADLEVRSFWFIVFLFVCLLACLFFLFVFFICSLPTDILDLEFDCGQFKEILPTGQIN